MDTSYRQKLLALAASFGRSPRDFVPWLRYLPIWGRRPADVELPWFSSGAIRYLERNLRPAHRVFEYGSGGSTFFFARRTAMVLSMESDAVWHRLVTGLLRDRSLGNVTCELHPLADDTVETFRRSPFSQRIRPGPWDVVIVDCHCGFQADRYGLIRPAALADAFGHVAPGGFAVLDDSWMYLQLLAPRTGWEITDFRGPGPCRYGVTSTAIFRRLA